MTQLELARKKWEESTIIVLKTHIVGKYHKREFRQYGQALSWLERHGDQIEIKKLETLRAGNGEATRLLNFLKAIVQRYGLRIFGGVSSRVSPRKLVFEA